MTPTLSQRTLAVPGRRAAARPERAAWYRAAIATFAAVALAGCGRAAAAESPFDTVTVRRGDLVATVSATGTLAAVGTVNVGTQVSGTIERVRVDFNDRVRAGDLLAVLETESLDASVRIAESGVDRARAALRQAEADAARTRAQAAQAEAQGAEAHATLERNRTLREKGFLSEEEFVRARTAAATAVAATGSADASVASSEAGIASARSSLASAEASLAQAAKNRRNAEIRAPISGVVIQRNVDEGQTVAASFSTPTLFVIAEDLGEMEILARVDESDIGLVEPGQHVRFTVAAYPDSTFQGVVQEERLQPETVQNVVLYTVVVEADNASGLLLPGMTATLDFVVGGVQEALLVPVAALRFDPPEELRAAARDAQRSGDTATRAAATAPRRIAADVAEVWTTIPGDDGPTLRPLLVRVLATDGTSTAIAPVTASDTTVRAGLVVVTRANTQGSGPFGR